MYGEVVNGASVPRHLFQVLLQPPIIFIIIIIIIIIIIL
jgi:hypothetical protein